MWSSSSEGILAFSATDLFFVDALQLFCGVIYSWVVLLYSYTWRELPLNVQPEVQQFSVFPCIKTDFQPCFLDYPVFHFIHLLNNANKPLCSAKEWFGMPVSTSEDAATSRRLAV